MKKNIERSAFMRKKTNDEKFAIMNVNLRKQRVS